MKRQRYGTIDAMDADTAARTQAFFDRHGGPGAAEVREGESEAGRRGWTEVDAADGYKLRCDWFRVDNQEQLTWSEIPP
jgi:hypothetical protein